MSEIDESPERPRPTAEEFARVSARRSSSAAAVRDVRVNVGAPEGETPKWVITAMRVTIVALLSGLAGTGGVVIGREAYGGGTSAVEFEKVRDHAAMLERKMEKTETASSEMRDQLRDLVHKVERLDEKVDEIHLALSPDDRPPRKPPRR